jgi:hypothetical protein
MSYLKKIVLTTSETVEFTFDELCNIVIPLIQLNVLILNIKKWVGDDDQQFVEGDRLLILFEQFMPQLKDFFCSIWTTNYIDMEVNSSI